MGILDDFQFDPSTFAGAPAGWLGPLLQPQSGPGFVQSPAQLLPYLAPMSGGATFPQAAAGKAPGAVAPPPSGADGFGKEPGASNPFTDFLSSFGNGIGNAFFPSAAAPTGPQTSPSLLDRLSAGATNFATGGSPIGGFLNSMRGLATGERTDPAGIRQANQTATFNALVGAGVAPQFAQVAALNPDILKTLVAAHFNAHPPQKTGTPGASPAGSPAPQSSIAGRVEVEAGGSQPTAEAGQDSGFAGRPSPAIAGGVAVPRPAQAAFANQPARPLDPRLATLRRQFLSGPALLPLVPTPRPPR